MEACVKLTLASDDEELIQGPKDVPHADEQVVVEGGTE